MREADGLLQQSYQEVLLQSKWCIFQDRQFLLGNMQIGSHLNPRYTCAASNTAAGEGWWAHDRQKEVHDRQ
jgi:hypothetical protein